MVLVNRDLGYLWHLFDLQVLLVQVDLSYLANHLDLGRQRNLLPRFDLWHLGVHCCQGNPEHLGVQGFQGRQIFQVVQVHRQDHFDLSCHSILRDLLLPGDHFFLEVPGDLGDLAFHSIQGTLVDLQVHLALWIQELHLDLWIQVLQVDLEVLDSH